MDDDPIAAALDRLTVTAVSADRTFELTVNVHGVVVGHAVRRPTHGSTIHHATVVLTTLARAQAMLPARAAIVLAGLCADQPERGRAIVAELRSRFPAERGADLAGDWSVHCG